MPERLSDTQLHNVEVYAASPLPALEAGGRKAIQQFSRLMTDMPRQGLDDATAAVKAENMDRHLGRLPMPCLSWMMSVVHARFTFYPSIKELLDLAAEWRRDDDEVRARAKAAVMARAERQARLDEARRDLRRGTLEQAAIDALPERSKKILETEGLLRHHPDDDSYTARVLVADPDAAVDLGSALGRIAAKFAGAENNAEDIDATSRQA